MKQRFFNALVAFCVLSPGLAAHADVAIQDLKLIREKAQVQADGSISLDAAFAASGLPAAGAELSDTDVPSNAGSYPSQYTSGSYPSQYTSTSYPSQYTSTSYPSQYTSTSYPSQYTSTSYPSQYTSTSYPSQYTSSSYPAQYTEGGSSLTAGPQIQEQRYQQLPSPVIDLR